MQDEESSNTPDECATPGTQVRTHGSSGDQETPGRDDHSIEKESLVLAMQTPVQFEAEQVLRIWTDFVHGRVLVANVQLVFRGRHDGREFEVACRVTSILVMGRDVLVVVRVSPLSSAVATQVSKQKVTLEFRDAEAASLNLKKEKRHERLSTDLRRAS